MGVMDTLVCVIWSVALLIYIPGLKAELSTSIPASTTVSVKEATFLFVTSKISNRKVLRISVAPQHISSSSTEAPGASTASFSASTTILTANHTNPKITDTKEPSTDASIGTDIDRLPESITSTNATQDIAPSFIPLTSNTITPGSSIPSFTKLSEKDQNSSQPTTTERIPTVTLTPTSVPVPTLIDMITASASSEKENQDAQSELDVGDEDSDKVPSSSPLDPLLAGLISIFIISTALLSIILFLKFHQQSGHPEFHRLQDLPMDDLLEDTPLSRYSY